jgi:hypothetical protein
VQLAGTEGGKFRAALEHTLLPQNRPLQEPIGQAESNQVTSNLGAFVRPEFLAYPIVNKKVGHWHIFACSLPEGGVQTFAAKS